MKTTKRKFSPAQLAAQKRFAAMAKAGTLKRKKRNTTIIKAKKISHLDVSKVHNPRRGMREDLHIIKRRAAAEARSEEWKERAKGSAVRRIRAIREHGKKRNVSARRNAEHRDAQHPIHVRDYWQGRRGYKSQWQRAHEAGQRQLFGVKNPYWKPSAKFTALQKRMWNAMDKWEAATVKFGMRSPESDKAKTHFYQLQTALTNLAHLERAKHDAKAKNPKTFSKATVEGSKLWKALPRDEYQALLGQLRWVNRVGWNSAGTVKAIQRTVNVTKQQASQMAAFFKIAFKVPLSVIETAQAANDPGIIDAYQKKNPRRGTRKLKGAVKRVERQRGGPYTAEQKRQFTAGWKTGRRQVSGAAKRKNGSNTSLARKRRAEFVGRPSTQTKTLYAPAGSGASGTLSQLGKLHKIAIKGGKVYNFKGVPTLAQHPKTDQLFVLGKNYTVNAPKKNPSDRMVDLGEVKTIEYEAVKTHLGDTKPVRYYHHFGEEGGKRPHALVNEEGLIIFSGGDYYIRPEGIRD